MKRLFPMFIGSFVCCAILAACGGGSDVSSQAPQKAVAVMKINQLSTPVVPIGGIMATLIIPYGVTVKTTSDPFQPEASVVQLLNAPTATNQASPTSIFSRYSAATPTSLGKLKFGIIDARGFTAPEQIIINLDIMSGFYPISSDFSMAYYFFSDINGVMLNITPTFTATIL